MGNQFSGRGWGLLMRDRDKSNWVLRLVPAPRNSDGPHEDSIPVIERADEHERVGAKIDDSDLDSSTGTTDAGPLFW